MGPLVVAPTCVHPDGGIGAVVVRRDVVPPLIPANACQARGHGSGFAVGGLGGWERSRQSTAHQRRKRAAAASPGVLRMLGPPGQPRCACCATQRAALCTHRAALKAFSWSGSSRVKARSSACTCASAPPLHTHAQQLSAQRTACTPLCWAVCTGNGGEARSGGATKVYRHPHSNPAVQAHPWHRGSAAGHLRKQRTRHLRDRRRRLRRPSRRETRGRCCCVCSPLQPRWASTCRHAPAARNP